MMKSLASLLTLAACLTTAAAVAVPKPVEALSAAVYKILGGPYSNKPSANQLLDGTPCRNVTVIFARGTNQMGNIGAANDVGPVFLNVLAELLGESNVAVQGVDCGCNILGFLAGGDPVGIKNMAHLVEIV